MKQFYIQSVFEAYTNSDLDEGRGQLVHIGYFMRYQDAERAAKGMGVMGSDASVRSTSVHVRIFESWEEFEAGATEERRQRALAKLNDEDLKALGLRR